MNIPVVQRVLQANDLLAQEVREMLERNAVVAFNVMGTPGSGKTSLIEQTFGKLSGLLSVGVIEGDIATSIDAERLGRLGVPVVQLNTGGECHLDAGMVKAAMARMNLAGLDLLFIENVGNLVCPAEFDLGESKRVVVGSVPEGDDKVRKYPVMFRLADAVVLNKTDLMPAVKFDLASYRSSLAELNPQAPLFEISCTTGANMDGWVEWVKRQVGKQSAA